MSYPHRRIEDVRHIHQPAVFGYSRTAAMSLRSSYTDKLLFMMSLGSRAVRSMCSASVVGVLMVTDMAEYWIDGLCLWESVVRLKGVGDVVDYLYMVRRLGESCIKNSPYCQRGQFAGK